MAYLNKYTEGEFLMAENVLIEAFGVMPQNQTTHTMKRLSNVMQRLKIQRYRQRVNGVLRRGYLVPQPTEEKDLPL